MNPFVGIENVLCFSQVTEACDGLSGGVSSIREGGQKTFFMCVLVLGFSPGFTLLGNGQ